MSASCLMHISFCNHTITQNEIHIPYYHPNNHEQAITSTNCIKQMITSKQATMDWPAPELCLLNLSLICKAIRFRLDQILELDSSVRTTILSESGDVS
jgi:hypothetical protein